MSSSHPTALEDQRIPVRAKLAAAWTSFVFLYAYVDILGFYAPGRVEDILHGRVYTFDITQTWAVTVLSILAVPILMVVLSMTLPARVARLVNLAVAALYVPFTAFNAVGDIWRAYHVLAVSLELILLALIVRYAWTWPRKMPAAAPAVPRSPAVSRDIFTE